MIPRGNLRKEERPVVEGEVTDVEVVTGVVEGYENA